MFIDIKQLDPAGLRFRGEVQPRPEPDPGPEELVVVSASLAGEVRPDGARALLQAELTARVELACNRCLEPSILPISTRFRLVLVRRLPPAPSGESEMREEDVALLEVPEGRADLAQIAMEQIYLNLPLKAVCRPDCRGLCPTCGANRNLVECGCRIEDPDPRLAPLLQFRKRMGRP